MNYEEAKMGIGGRCVSGNRNSRGGRWGAISFAAIKTVTGKLGTVANCRLRPSTGRFAHFSEWEKSIKMSLIARDLMVGNPKFAEMGFGGEAHGRNAIASGFQGQRQHTPARLNGMPLSS
jgi:hypothetical protein